MMFQWKHKVHFTRFINTGDFHVLLMPAFQQHNLTCSCQDDLLRILSVLPFPAKIPSLSYVLRNKFIKFNDQCSVHYFCSCCSCSLPLSTTQCVTVECIDSPHQPVSQYIHLSLSTQLQQHFQGECIEYSIFVSILCSCIVECCNYTPLHAR